MSCLKRVGIPSAILLYAVSGGLYGLYWIVSRSYCVYFSQGGGRKHFYSFAVAIIAVYFVLLFLFTVPVFFHAKEGESNFSSFRTILFPLAITIHLLLIIMAVHVAKYVNSCGLQRVAATSVVVVLTLLGFTSALYLQSRINAMGKDHA